MVKKNYIELWTGNLLILLIFFSATLTTQFMAVKLVLLLSILSLMTISIIYGCYHGFEKRYELWMFFYFLSCCIPLIHGVIRGNPGIKYYITLSFLWPLLFPIIFSNFKEIHLEKFNKMIKWAYIVLLITGFIAFFQYNFGLFSSINLELLGFDESERPLFLFKTISGPVDTSMFAIFTYYFSYLILEDSRISVRNLFLILCGILYLVLTSRRIFIGCIFIMPLLVLILSRLAYSNNKHLKKNLLMVFMPIGVIAFLGMGYVFMDSESMMLFFSSSISEEGDFGVGGNVRVDQYEALLNEWDENFWFGAGTGIDAKGISRSDIPGNYELTYIAMLFSQGLIGATFSYIVLLLPIIWSLRLIRKCKDEYLKRMLISSCIMYTIFLIAVATNPYLGAFDYMWILFVFPTLQSIATKKFQLNKREYNG